MKQPCGIVCLLTLLASGCAAESERAGLTPASQDEIALPAPAREGAVSLEHTLAMRRSVRAFSEQPLTLKALSQVLWAAQGVSEARSGFRTAPSAGATYPLQTYVAVGPGSDLEAGVYRYRPAAHALVRVVEGDQRRALAQAALGQGFVASAPTVVVLAAVHERTAQRYGKRAERYVPMEAGHAGQNLALQAVALELGTVMVGAFRDDQVSRILDLPTGETPLYLIPVGHPRH